MQGLASSGQVARLSLQAVADDAGALFAMVFALLLGRGDGSGRRPAARIVPILHAFLEESITRLALQSLLVAPNVQVAIFCFASTAKHGPVGKSTIRTAARNAQRDMLDLQNS